MRYFLNNTEVMAIDNGQECLIQDYWVECEANTDGLPYTHYNNDGSPNYEEIDKYKITIDIEEQVYHYKKFLNDTDYKMTIDYFASMSEVEKSTIIEQRAVARAYIRVNYTSDKVGE